ncbi:TIR domain-containing protein [candidate division KSB1 bacterium]|nr:TIR domain-containing protein [candidate division KSB1 bacterium]
MSTENPRIFISYARADSEFALKLGKDLRSAGADIWIDQLMFLVVSAGIVLQSRRLKPADDFWLFFHRLRLPQKM